MADVSETFVLLGMAERPKAETKLLTRALDLTIGDREVLLGIDSLGQRHLLVPAATESVATDRASQGAVLAQRLLTHGKDDVVYADLYCTIPRLDLVFERLAMDVVLRLEKQPSQPVDTVRMALDDWRALLRSAGQGVDRETVVGLIGELEVLRLLANHDAPAALNAWRGPTKSVHDFVCGGSELEVKTTVSVDGNFVAISNLDQLDPALVDRLHLAVVHAREDDAGPTLDDRLDELIRLGVPRESLLTKTKDAGYVYESDPQINTRYTVRGVRVWRVDQRFPGLRSSDLSVDRRRGVAKVQYELALDTAPPPLTAGQLATLMATWLGGST